MATPTPSPNASHKSSACASVFTQARSAAYIGCSGSIASGILLERAWGEWRRCRLPPCGARAWISREPFGKPPTTRTRHSAPSADASSIARLLSSMAACRPAWSGRRKHPAAAIAAHFHAVVLDRANGRIKADGRDLVAPRIDRSDAVPCAGFDGFAQIPLLHALSRD